MVDAADEDFEARFKAAQKNLKTAVRERNQVVAELAPEAKVDLSAITDFITSMRKALDQQSNSAKRAYLRSVIDAIEVGEKTIKIYGRR